MLHRYVSTAEFVSLLEEGKTKKKALPAMSFLFIFISMTIYDRIRLDHMNLNKYQVPPNVEVRDTLITTHVNR